MREDDAPGLAEFDVLVACDAGAMTDGEFLVGAVLARRWVLVGGGGQVPAPLDEVYVEHLDALAELATAERAAARPPSEEPPAETGASPFYDDGDRTRADLPASEAPRLSPEAERIASRELWEGHYRESYARALRRMTPDDADPGPRLADMLTELLGHSVFERCRAAAPDLFTAPPPGPAETASDSE